jgi:hypothetical protein
MFLKPSGSGRRIDPERKLNSSGAGGPAGDVRDVSAGKPDVFQFAAGQAVQLERRFAKAAPFVERAYQVHFHIHFVASGSVVNSLFLFTTER